MFLLIAFGLCKTKYVTETVLKFEDFPTTGRIMQVPGQETQICVVEEIGNGKGNRTSDTEDLLDRALIGQCISKSYENRTLHFCYKNESTLITPDRNISLGNFTRWDENIWYHSEGTESCNNGVYELEVQFLCGGLADRDTFVFRSFWNSSRTSCRTLAVVESRFMCRSKYGRTGKMAMIKCINREVYKEGMKKLELQQKTTEESESV